jgi:ankyrin repeat protein
VAELLLVLGARQDIFAAAARGDLAAVRGLLDRDHALIASHAADGWTPLHLAAHFGQAEAVQQLLEAGASIDTRSTNQAANTALHAALAGQSLAATELLLAAGADVNARQYGGFTPLQAAAQHGDLALIELLLRHGADPSLAADDGRTASEMAEGGGHAEASALLRG